MELQHEHTTVNSRVLESAALRLNRSAPALPVRVYLLGSVDYQAALLLQHRLVDEVSAGAAPALVCCEHPPLITVGRAGSHAHMELDLGDRVQRSWPVRWVNRGGGCWFQSPGQLAVYPILPIQHLGVSLFDYVRRLQSSLLLLVREFGIVPHAVGPDVFVGHRPIACVGAAVRDGTSYFGAIVNVNPDLSPFRQVRTGRGHSPMTSLQRECRRPFRAGYVRERLVEHFVAQLDLSETHFFTSHPSLGRKAFVDAFIAAR